MLEIYEQDGIYHARYCNKKVEGTLCQCMAWGMTQLSENENLVWDINPIKEEEV